MKTLNLFIVMMTGALVFFMAAYILDLSMRSKYSNANLLVRLDVSTKASEWSQYTCAHYVPGCHHPMMNRETALAPKTITF